jgi:hypothetical protein
MKRITFLLFIIGMASILLSSCKKEGNNPNSEAQLIIKTTSAKLNTASAGISSGTKSALAGSDIVVLDTFLINIKDIKFEFDESNSGKKTDSCIDDCSDDCNNNADCDDKSGDCQCSNDCNDSANPDIQSKGPYLINVLSSDVLNGKVIDNFSLPNAVYDEIEFDLAICELTYNTKMLGHSIYLAGTINGNRFKIWTSNSREIEIKFHDQSALNLTGETIKLYIDISLEKILASLGAINLGAAADGNNNGYIEIGNNDTDGNKIWAGAILKAITGCFDLDDVDCED